MQTKIDNNTLMQLVLNNIPSFVFWKDDNSIYLGCNENFAKSAGFSSPEDVVGRSDYDMPWSQEEADFFRKVDKEVMLSGEAQINFEEQQTINDKSTRWLRTSKIPLYDDQKNVIGILGTYEDITARKTMELEIHQQNAELLILNDKLESINMDLEHLVNASSHDLQEPLRTIGSFVGLLEKKYGSEMDDKAKEYLKYIKGGSARMSKLIKQILTFSKIDKVDIVFESVNAKKFISNILRDLTHSINEQNAVVESDILDIYINCQQVRMEMVFHNLIGNALKFNNSQNPKISISLTEDDKSWLFEIKDNGIGISNKFDHNIFEPFKRLNTQATYPGSGIGLSICKRIVDMHGGEIWYESKEGEGSSFFIKLPKLIIMNEQVG